MRTCRRAFLKTAGLALAAPLVLSRAARGAEVNLRLQHALPPSDGLQAAFLVAWASGICEASGGRLDIQLLPAMQRGGTPWQLTDQVRDGRVDMAWVAASDSGGQFPRLQALHLPFVAARTSLINSQVAQELADRHAAAEFPDLQLLIAAAGDSAVIHATKQIASLAELKGVRLRPPTMLAGEALQALGAVAVSVEDELLPEAFAQNILDGGAAAWGGAPDSLQELGFHTEIPGSPALCVSTFLLVMNKARFAGLPEDLRRVLMERSGLNGARLAGQSFDARSAEIAAAAQARGSTIVQLAADEKARWVEMTKSVVAAWVERSRARELDGNALLAETSALFVKYEPPAPPAPPQPVAPQTVAPTGQAPVLQPGSFTAGTVPPGSSAQPLVAPVGPVPDQLTPIQPSATP